MAFEEMNAQTALMDSLFLHASEIKRLTKSSHLLADPRYSKALASINEAARLLVQAQDEIGYVTRLPE